MTAIIVVASELCAFKHRLSLALSWDAGTGVHDGVLPPCLLRGRVMGAQVPLRNSIISNFMIYQDRLETNLLQLFAHT